MISKAIAFIVVVLLVVLAVPFWLLQDQLNNVESAEH